MKRAAGPFPEAEERGPIGRIPSLRRALPAAAFAFLFAALVLLAGTLARREAATALSAEAEASLPLAVAALRSELEKQRALPLILSDDAAVEALLTAPDRERLAAADEKLRRLALSTRAAVIYLLDRDGRAIAASNYREPTSFVGSDYRFRRYYTGAMAEGAAAQYALGTVSNRPGVYFSRRIDARDGSALGVVVVKVELDAVEADWREAGRPVYVADMRGIVLATSVPDWRFRALRPLAADVAADIRDSLQFGAARLDPLPVAPAGSAGGVPLVRAGGTGGPGDGSGTKAFLEVAAPVEGGLPPGWTLHLLVPAERALLTAATVGSVVAALVLALLGAAGTTLLRRGRRARQRLDDQTRAAAELETRVGLRTAELRDANGRLLGEIAERAKAEARILALREDLIQANRLASLGQITAGVAHEINQPLAAIRTYAENAGRFLSLNNAAAAGANLATVVELTERIGTITETLRSFSRRATGPVEPLALEAPIEGAMLILLSRLSDSGVTLARGPVDPGLTVLGNKIRLEQVLVNLVRNAIEALAGAPDPRIRLDVETTAEDVFVHVRDNGPGISPDILAKLFTPFSTSKPKGLGLGLVISGDILAELGGALQVESRPGEGAHFTVRLRRVRG